MTSDPLDDLDAQYAAPSVPAGTSVPRAHAALVVAKELSAVAEEGRRPSQATELVEMASARYELGCSLAGEPFAVLREGAYVARMLRGGGGSLRAELAHLYSQEHGRTPSSSALADTLLVLEGRAHNAAKQAVALRVAASGSAAVLDLGGADGHVVVVDRDGWRVEERSPVLFRRTALTVELPVPVRRGSLDELRKLLNIADDSWPVLLAFLVAALTESIPHPVLLLLGEQGVGKSTVERMVAGLIDPSAAETRTAPRDVEQWAVAASGSWLVPLDNVSSITPWLSDALCRAVTGDGVVRRRLYSDDDLAVLAFRRVVLLTAIDPGALRGDLADRLVTIELKRIAPHQRRLDRDLAVAYQDARPRVLGALLDLTAAVLAVLPGVRLEQHPRMADFARIVVAVDRVLGTDALSTYLGQAQSLAVQVVGSDPVATRIDQLLAEGDQWSETAGELLERLTPDPPERPPKDWPASGQSLAAALKRAAPALRAVGISVEYGARDDDSRSRKWTLAKQAPKDPEDEWGDQESDPGGKEEEAGEQVPGLPGLPAHAADQQKRAGQSSRTPRALLASARTSAGTSARTLQTPDQQKQVSPGSPGSPGSPAPVPLDVPPPGDADAPATDEHDAIDSVLAVFPGSTRLPEAAA